MFVGDSIFHFFIGGVALIFFGFCAFAISWRAIKHVGAVIVLSSDGILDVRISNRPIAWQNVRNTFIYTLSGQNLICLETEHWVLKEAEPTKIASMMWNANNALVGVEGIHITTQGLRLSAPLLYEKITEYWSMYGK